MLLIIIIISSISSAFSVSNASVGSGLNDFSVKLSSQGKNVSVSGVDDKKDISGFLNDFQVIIMGVSAIVVFVISTAFMINITKLGTSGGNPQARSQAITGLLWTGLAIVLVGGAGIMFGVFFVLI